MYFQKYILNSGTQIQFIFSVCSNDEEANRCYHRKTEKKIQDKCECHYGLLNRGNPDNLRRAFKCKALKGTSS